MKLGVVSAYDSSNPSFPEEAQPFIDYVKDRHDVHLISPVSYNGQDGVVDSFDVSGSVVTRQKLADFDSIYFGLVGKNILSLNQTHCFSDQLAQIGSLLSEIETYAPNSLVNPLETIYSNTSKQYLLDLDLPFISTTRIRDLDDLKTLHSDDQGYIAKPLVAERAQGTIVLDGSLSDQDLESYFHRYHEVQSLIGTNENMQPTQGIIVQPYQNDFMTTGEKKVGVVNGNVTLSRVAVPKDSHGYEVVSVSRGARMLPYAVTDLEQELCMHAYSKFNEAFGASYLRVDLVGEGNHLKINELEAINPSFATRNGLELYTPEQLRYHNECLEQALLSAVRERV